MLVLTRDPVADRISSVVVAALTRTRRGLVSELVLSAAEDGVPSDCVVNFDNVHGRNPVARFRGIADDTGHVVPVLTRRRHVKTSPG